ncbi:unnamed protein product, partial [Mesorhabditis spiculigera]
MKLLLASLFIGYVTAELYNATVKGTVICNKRKQSGIKLKLKEHDTFSKDDDLGSTTTDDQGNFEIFGKDEEWYGFRPYIVIYHNCRTLENGCLTRSRYEYPQSAVNGVYDMSYVALDIATAEESAKCP